MLNPLPTEAIDALIAFTSGRTTIPAFEAWLYAQPWLDSGLSRDEFLGLAGADFRTPQGARVARDTAIHVLRQRVRELSEEPETSILWVLPSRLRASCLGLVDGTRDLLWTAADASAVIRTLTASGWLILGLDGWLRSGGRFVPSYSTWALSSEPSDPASLAVPRSCVEALRYLERNALGSTAFSVVARRPEAGPV